MYELCITTGLEVELFWSGKITGATALFLSNKYTTLLYNILGLITFYPAISDAVRNICSIIRALLTIVEEVRPTFSL